MTLGYYQVDTSGTQSTYWSTNNTVAELVKFDKDVDLRSLSFRFHVTGTFNGNVVVYNNSTGALIASGPVQSLSVTSTTELYEIPFSSAVRLTANTSYRVGLWTGTGTTPFAGATNSTNSVFTSSQSYATMTDVNGFAYYNNGQASPGTAVGYSMPAVYSFDGMEPIVLSVTPADNSTVNNKTSVSFSWTAGGGSAQTGYELGYRKTAGSTFTWTKLTGTTATSVSVPAETFVDGTTYEWYVKLNSAAGWGPPSARTYFTASNGWTTSTEVTSATASGVIDASAFTTGNYDFEVRVADASGIYGDWSPLTTIALGPPSNVWVKQGGVWKQAVNYAKVSGAFKQIAPTGRSYDGFFKDAALTTFTTSSPERSIAYDLSGTTQATLLFSGNFQTQDTDTLGIWFEFTTNSNTQAGFYLTNKAQDGTPGYFDVMLNAANTLERVRAPRPANGVEHNFAIVFDKTQPAGGKIKVFIDGAKQTTVNVTTAAGTNVPFANSSLYVMSRGGTTNKVAGQVSNTPILVPRAYSDTEAINATS